MSEPKLISPMLDNFAMGDPIIDSNGIRCCPAMHMETEEKFIVKIISVPASQTQLDALLLSGAYKDKEDALTYYSSLADGITEEAQLLQKLSQVEGFVSYEKWQTVPMDEEETGFDVYLLNSYKNSMEQFLRRNTMSHLGVLNLGLDICSALTACRRAGYLYVDLKPENIYITGEHEYRIGEIGFLKLDSLKYASLPERYRSAYTAPEIQDAYSAMNTTVDIYALGLILYQAFNDGALPSRSDADQAEAFPPPAYADYEMAEIILKACAPDPADRWQDPAEMGQALVNYMQRNGAHDTPIVPAPVEVAVNDEDESVNVTDEDQQSLVETETDNAQLDTEEDKQKEDTVYEEDEEGNLSFLTEENLDVDELEDLEEISDVAVTDEVTEILEQADDLIAHQAPDPVIPPEPIEVSLPDPIPVEETEVPEEAPESGGQETEAETREEAEEDTNTEDEVSDQIEDPEDTDNAERTDESDSVSEPEENSDDQDDDYVEVPRKKSHWLRNILLSLMAVAIIALGFLYYKHFYLQPVDSISLDDSEIGTLIVSITSTADESKLTVVCSDTYGNQLYAPVENGKAKFTNLAPNSAYTVRVEINGFHKLTGDTSTAFTTPKQTEIVQFNAVTGSENGCAVLSFTIDGPDAQQWIIRYSAEGEEEKEITFSGHMATVTGLTVGKDYLFKLAPAEELIITGTTEIQHRASNIITAENLQITGCANNVLTVVWNAPADTAVENWTVRCYNESGYDETKVVTETNAVFEGTDPASEYTVEVTAAGMSVNQRAFAAANSLTVIRYTAEDSDPNQIVLTWEPLGNIPQGGWLLQYSINGAAQQEISCPESNTATISTEIPGVRYTFTLVAADGTPVLGGIMNYDTPAAASFEGYGVTANAMEFKMCKTPKSKNWDRYDLNKSDYTTEFESGKKGSFLIHVNKSYSTSSDQITSLFVIRDANGAIVSSASTVKSWTNMWYRNYCELDIPALPTAAGDYTISIYFNGMLANEQAFKIVG